MSSDFPPNPYSSPKTPGSQFPTHGPADSVKGKVLPPAIFLCIVGALGLIMSVVNVVLAFVIEPQPVPPDAPDFMKGFQQGQTGPVAAAIQGFFAILNIVIIAGAVMMMKVKAKPMAFVSAIAAMINIGTCCCIIGLPAGIWSLVILLQPDVSKAFDQNSA
jgi:hypothetical protein